MSDLLCVGDPGRTFLSGDTITLADGRRAVVVRPPEPSSQHDLAVVRVLPGCVAGAAAGTMPTCRSDDPHS
jgi:hypothetical protein